MAEIILKCTETEEDVYEYEIKYDQTIILINFQMLIKNDILYLNKLNIEGEGPNIFGSRFLKVAKEISKIICEEFGVTKIEINGTKRTSKK